MIDYTDPAQTTHQGKPIPIDSQEKFDTGLQIMKDLYAFTGVPWSQTAEDAYEQRVRNGQTGREVIGYTADEFLTRTSNEPGA